MPDCTKRISPLFRADADLTNRHRLAACTVDTMQRRLTIISIGLPKVALINPLAIRLAFADNSPVEYDNIEASGKIAKKLRIKAGIEFQPKAPKMIPSGIKTRRTLAWLQNNVLSTASPVYIRPMAQGRRERLEASLSDSTLSILSLAGD
jgi:hypothetical protein